MLDQNTDRTYWMIGAVVVVAAGDVKEVFVHRLLAGDHVRHAVVVRGDVMDVVFGFIDDVVGVKVEVQECLIHGDLGSHMMLLLLLLQL